MPDAALQRFNVSIANRQRVRAINSRLLRRIVQTLLSELPQVRHADLGIRLVAGPEMTRLNETFLRHAGSTDVVTFDYSDDVAHLGSEGILGAPHASALQGEIVICLDEAVAQASRYRTTWHAELVRYTIHGILHLLGFDDLKPAARRKMKREESRWLRKLARRFTLTRLARRRANL